MSLRLDLGTKPKGLEVKTFGLGSMGNIVHLGDYEISLKDFLIATEYVLTNTDLEANDARRQFVRRIRSMKEVDGYSPNGKRLEVSDSASPLVKVKAKKKQKQK